MQMRCDYILSCLKLSVVNVACGIIVAFCTIAAPTLMYQRYNQREVRSRLPSIQSGASDITEYPVGPRLSIESTIRQQRDYQNLRNGGG